MENTPHNNPNEFHKRVWKYNEHTNKRQKYNHKPSKDSMLSIVYSEKIVLSNTDVWWINVAEGKHYEISQHKLRTNLN